MTARHFMQPGSIQQEHLIADIQADITSAHGAAKSLEEAGSTATAQRMRAATDGYLDELSRAKAGTWQPNHPI
ncbi:hypothetical protein ACFQ7F_08245 [Streptomyces sp. NPDC056486]|uniref:hypothetical protein n=1 Tax=Streptomyces sp. NPDC056486 TaxID=3345835 RepID=UPI0036A9FD83